MISKEAHDTYIEMMIKNLAYDEAAFNITNRLSFREPSDVVGVVWEELDETKEALEQLDKAVKDFYECIRYNEERKVLLSKLNLISLQAEFLVHESLQVKAVALKALKQIPYEEVDKLL